MFPTIGQLSELKCVCVDDVLISTPAANNKSQINLNQNNDIEKRANFLSRGNNKCYYFLIIEKVFPFHRS